MNHKPLNEQHKDAIQIGRIALSVPAFLALFAALSMMAFAVAGLVGVDPESAPATAGLAWSKSILWAFFMLAVTFGLAHFCKKSEQRQVGTTLQLAGLGIMAGALISLAL